MVTSCTNPCAHCAAEIVKEQRWVRERIYEAAVVGRESRYRRYHAELFDGQTLSCWEKHLLQLDRARLAA
jgi:hypothetical protein